MNKVYSSVRGSLEENGGQHRKYPDNVTLGSCKIVVPISQQVSGVRVTLKLSTVDWSY